MLESMNAPSELISKPINNDYVYDFYFFVRMSMYNMNCCNDIVLKLIYKFTIHLQN